MNDTEWNSRATEAIEDVLSFAMQEELIEAEDRLFCRNLLLDVLHMDAPSPENGQSRPLAKTFTPMCQTLSEIAVQRGIIENTADERDRFGARIAGCVTPSPATVRERFRALYATQGPRAATDWLYKLSRACDYIRVDQIARNVRYFQDTPAGELEITINLSKPEKDPRDIAKALSMPKVGYPACMLCIENPGYAGRTGYPARFNHRMVPLTLDGSRWYLQYSPYAYYEEHCIVLNARHVPMRVSRQTFVRLLDFVERFPHYFLGSNADLPIVGGSILTHDHFQGGQYTFPMDKAVSEIALTAPVAGVEAAIVQWPMSCVRLTSDDREKLIDLAAALLDAWRGYTDETLGILAETDAPHNTVTPIARMADGRFRLDLVLRNNRTSDEHPLGIFHPHADLHHIKKENIGLIEVMGLFILPGRLLGELDKLSGYLTGDIPIDRAPESDSPLAKHYGWIRDIAAAYGTSLTKDDAVRAIREALGVKCARVLADAGVYKQTPEGREGFLRFLRTVGYDRA